MPMIPHIYAVIPVHNRKHYTQKCLQCLDRQTWKELSVIVVDDGSTDGTSEMIREKFPEVILLHGDGNLWWTAATNLGIRQALEMATDDDYVLVLNDDLEVDKDFVENLVRFAEEHPKSLVGAVTVDINDPDHRIHYGGVVINWWTAKSRVLNQGARLSDFEPGYYVEASYLTGRGTLIPVEVFHMLGLYDNKHFQQCGDTELPVRASWHSYKLFIIYNAVVKSQLAESDQINWSSTYRLADWKKYFFGIKSNMRIKYCYYFARTAANRNPLRFFSYLLFDLMRISYHFLSRVRF